jgi:CheY-like chemotaxis protein
VDDTAFNIEIVQMMIQFNFGLNCDSAISGIQAIEKIKKRIQRGKECYKLILMDINMPIIDGGETVKRLRRLYGNELKNSTIIAYTAIPREQFGSLSEKKFDGYLSKPSKLQDIKDILVQAKLI